MIIPLMPQAELVHAAEREALEEQVEQYAVLIRELDQAGDDNASADMAHLQVHMVSVMHREKRALSVL